MNIRDYTINQVIGSIAVTDFGSFTVHGVCLDSEGPHLIDSEDTYLIMVDQGTIPENMVNSLTLTNRSSYNA